MKAGLSRPALGWLLGIALALAAVAAPAAEVPAASAQSAAPSAAETPAAPPIVLAAASRAEAPAESPASPAPQSAPPGAGAYEAHIAGLEGRGGPYAAELSEQLLGLGAVYQAHERHAEAIPIFKRGAHIARVNHGLHNVRQIPILKRLIQSLLAVGDVAAASDRQHHLFKIQREYYGEEGDGYVRAILERAEWEEEALGLKRPPGPHDSRAEGVFARQVKILDLYNLALSTIKEQDGDHSEKLAAPLARIMGVRYDIALRGDASREELGYHMQISSYRHIDPNDTERILLSNYRHGKRNLETMREVYQSNADGESPRPPQALVFLGDWHLLHGKRDSARDAYLAAWDELSALADGARELERLFGEPAPLPELPGRPRAQSAIQPPDEISGYAEVSYMVSAGGRVRNLELRAVEPVQEGAGNGPRLLIKRLKNRQFRPMMVNRELVGTGTINERYAY